MATELATGYVALVPSFQGGGRQIQEQLGGPVDQAADEAGRRGGSRFGGAFAGAMSGVLAAGLLEGAFSIVGDAFTLAIEQADLPGSLRSQFALSEKDAAAAAKVAGDLYAGGFGESLSGVGETASALTRELTLLGDAGDLSDLTAQAETLASKFGAEVTPLINAASQAVKTGLAPDMASAFDIITVGFQNGANAGDDLLDTLIEYSGQFQKLGLEGPAAIGLINQGLEAGARNGDLVADAFKEFSIRAIDGSKLSAEGFEALGLSASEMTATIAAGGPEASAALDTVLDSLRNMEDPVARDAAAVALFGTQAEDLGAALYALDPSEATAKLGEYSGAAQKAADASGEGTQAKLNTLTRAFEGGLADALVTVLPLLNKVMDFLTPLLPVLAPIAVAIGAVAAAQWVWNTALLANPIIAIIAAIIAAIVLLVVYWDEVVAALTVAWNWIKDLAVTVWNSILDFFKEWGPLLFAILTGGISLLVTWIIENWDTIWATTVSIFTAIGDFFVMIWDWIVDVFDTAVQGVIDFFSMLGELPGKAWDWFMSVLDAAIQAFGDLVDWVSGVPGDILDALGNVASYLWNAGSDLLDGLLQGMKDAAGAVFDWISGLLVDVKDQVLDFFGIASPSKLMRSYGQFIGEGLALGIQDSVADVRASSDLMVHAADLETPTVRGLLSEMDQLDATGPPTYNITIQAADNRFDMNDLQDQIARQLT